MHEPEASKSSRNTTPTNVSRSPKPFTATEHYWATHTLKAEALLTGFTAQGKYLRPGWNMDMKRVLPLLGCPKWYWDWRNYSVKPCISLALAGQFIKWGLMRWTVTADSLHQVRCRPPNPGHSNIKYLSHLLGGQGYKCPLDRNQDRGTGVYVYESLQNTIKSRRRLE